MSGVEISHDPDGGGIVSRTVDIETVPSGESALDWFFELFLGAGDGPEPG